jgi:hypothetical protein
MGSMQGIIFKNKLKICPIILDAIVEIDSLGKKVDFVYTMAVILKKLVLL